MHKMTLLSLVITTEAVFCMQNHTFYLKSCKKESKARSEALHQVHTLIK